MSPDSESVNQTGFVSSRAEALRRTLSALRSSQGTTHVDILYADAGLATAPISSNATIATRNATCGRTACGMPLKVESGKLKGKGEWQGLAFSIPHSAFRILRGGSFAVYAA